MGDGGNLVIVTGSNGWKYVDGKHSDRIKGKKVTPPMARYLTNGWQLGIAAMVGENHINFSGPHELLTKDHRFYIKRIRKQISIVYNAKNGGFVLNIWTQLPPMWVVYLTMAATNCMEIDVSAGVSASNWPVAYPPWQPAMDDTYRTTKILLRRIPAGWFQMGSPVTELGRKSDEIQRYVTISRDHYVGVCEITQAQYLKVMGGNPSTYAHGADGQKRPVETVTWSMARGGAWPWPSTDPSSSSFIGRLRAKTGLLFDLPTEAQWEYFCRAGTVKALNNDGDLSGLTNDPSVDVLGRYLGNGGGAFTNDPVNGAHTVVGSYQTNHWDLCDFHGNVAEWCLDWYGTYESVAVDPAGPSSGSFRVTRGGAFNSIAAGCRSAARSGQLSSYGSDSMVGFRIVVPAP